MRKSLPGLILFSIVVAILAGMTSCIYRVTSEANYDVIAVKSYPEQAYDTLQNTYGCTASVIHNIPATRYFRSGSQQDYTIIGIVGTKDVCK